MSKLIEFLQQIPVYPEGIKFNRNAQWISFSPETPICESDDGFLSWISQKAKDEYLAEYKWRNPHLRRTR